ncbi:MAG: Smr/MutS family protein [Erysipelotrichaceae bacterium]|nr:Smr/MutS family protein [Erysipelotrichaceae bacterium]
MIEYNALEFKQIKDQVAEYCSFSLGKELIRELHPVFGTLHATTENRRSKDALTCCVKYGPMPFYGVKDIRMACSAALKDGTLTAQELISCADHYRGVSSVLHYMSKAESGFEAIRELTSSLVYHGEVQNKIDSSIGPYGDILDSASPKLKSIRKQRIQTEAELNKEAQRFVSQNSARLQDTIITMRNDRVVVIAKISEKNSFGGIQYGESSSGQSAYVEPGCLIELNNRRQSLAFAEQEEIERILYECSQVVKVHANEMLSNLETLALLDACFAKAEWGRARNGVIAELTEQRVIRIHQGKHPLIDPKKVVSNNYHLGPDQKMLLITGPNTGGKTVSLKIIGLFVLMSVCGIPVTADEAELPLIDDLYVDIGDDQSITASLSTFSAHLSKLNEITRKASKKSLVLLDELGSGTDPKEGEALAIAVLDDLRFKGCMTIATSHYGGIKVYGRNHEEVLLASVQFDLKTMSPTFRYIEGISGQSNALSIARRFGLKDSILTHAEQILSSSKSTEDELLEKLDQKIQAVSVEQNELALLKEELEAKQRQLTHEMSLLDAKRETIMDEARSKAKEMLEEIELQAEIFLEELKESKEEVKQHQINQFHQKIRDLNPVEQEEEIEQNHEFVVNDSVMMKGSSQIGTILSISGNNVTISLGGLRVRSKLDQLRYVAKAPEKKKKTVISARIPLKKTTSFSMECNLIGLHVYEAMEVMDKYLDDALVHHMSTVRIIHGAGTGALRNAVHEKLRRRKDVSFRLGGQGEGGVGATVVTFVSKS